MLIRRVVPAIVVALGVYTGLAFAAGAYLREHYQAPVVTSSLDVPSSAWITSQWWTKGGAFAWAGRFWPFQWIEGGWLLALSALLIAATVWLVRRRAA